MFFFTSIVGGDLQVRLVSHGGRTAWGEGPGPAGPIYFSISWGGESTHRTQRRMYCFPVYRCLLLRPAVPAVPSVPQACRFSQEAFPHASPPQPHRACVCVCQCVSVLSLSLPPVFIIPRSQGRSKLSEVAPPPPREHVSGAMLNSRRMVRGRGRGLCP